MNINTFSGIFTIQEFKKHSETFGYGCLINKGSKKEETLFLRAKVFDRILIENFEKKWTKGSKIFAAGELRREEYKEKENIAFIINQAYTVHEQNIAAVTKSQPTEPPEPAVESPATINTLEEHIKF